MKIELLSGKVSAKLKGGSLYFKLLGEENDYNSEKYFVCVF